VSRRSIRWIVFSSLSLLVVALAIHSWISNASLLRNLLDDDPSVFFNAFGILHDRADSPRIFLELTIEERTKVAYKLAAWKDSRSAELMIRLLEDPAPRVRSALTASLSESAKQFPKEFLNHLTIRNTTQKAGIIEASFRAGEIGIEIAEEGFAHAESRPIAEGIFLRFGKRSYPTLSRLLMSNDLSVAVAASSVLARINEPRTETQYIETREISERLLQLFHRTQDPLQKNHLILAMSSFPSREMREMFLEKSRDDILPSSLRAACIRALANLEEWEVVARFLNSHDEEVFRAAAESLAKLGDKGVTYVLKSNTSHSRIAKALGKNECEFAEMILLQRATKNDEYAAKALSERKCISAGASYRALRAIRDPSISEKTRIYIARAISKSEQGKKELYKMIHDPIVGYSAYLALNIP